MTPEQKLAAIWDILYGEMDATVQYKHRLLQRLCQQLEVNMNLLEILGTLRGRKSDERRRLLVEWGIDEALWKHIQRCFDQEGNPIDAMGEKIEVEIK